MGYFQVDDGQVKIFLSEFNTQGRRGENDDVTALGRWAVGPSVNNSFPEHISESTDCLQISHTTPLGGSSCAFWGI